MNTFTFQVGLKISLISLIYLCLILATFRLNYIGQKFLKPQLNLLLGYGVPTLAMMVFLWIVTPPQSQHLFIDFNKGYYIAGKLVLENPHAMYEHVVGDLAFVNIPIIALLFIPFSLFSESTAGFLMLFLGILATLAACWFSVQITRVSGWRRLALIGIFIINEPLYYSLKWGNSTHFVLLLLLGAIFSLQKKREIWVGVLLAIAALIKIPLLFLGAYFALRGRWRVFLGFGVALLAIVGTSLLLFGIDLHLFWFYQCIQPFAGKVLGAYNVQSVDGFLARLLLNADLHGWIPIEVDWRFKLIRYAVISLLIGGTIWSFWSCKKPTTLEAENLEFSIVLCLALVVTPISWLHYYLFLLLPLSLYLGNKLAVTKGWWFNLMALSALLISMPTVDSKPGNPVFSFLNSNLLISHNFLGGILLLVVLLAARWHNSVVTQKSVESTASRVR